jgi:membrane-bound ClpP family serine protease
MNEKLPSRGYKIAHFGFYAGVLSLVVSFSGHKHISSIIFCIGFIVLFIGIVLIVIDEFKKQN